VFLLSSADTISLFAGEGEAGRVTANDDAPFSSVDELESLTAVWLGSRLIAMWNGIPGVKAT
jgi:hypothetical protein